MNGFVYNGNCVSVCPDNYYGYIEYDIRGKLTKSECQLCDPSCLHCAKSGSQFCTECPYDSFLTRMNANVSYGTCGPKINDEVTAELYVTPNAATIDV